MARFAAIGLDHRHVNDMTHGLLSAGMACVGYCPETTDPRALAGLNCPARMVDDKVLTYGCRD